MRAVGEITSKAAGRLGYPERWLLSNCDITKCCPAPSVTLTSTLPATDKGSKAGHASLSFSREPRGPWFPVADSCLPTLVYQPRQSLQDRMDLRMQCREARFGAVPAPGVRFWWEAQDGVSGDPLARRKQAF